MSLAQRDLQLLQLETEIKHKKSLLIKKKRTWIKR